MKYRLAKDFLIWKKQDMILFPNDKVMRIFAGVSNTSIDIDLIEHLDYFLEQGVIEEVPEKEFTEYDMIDFARYYVTDCNISNCSEMEALQQWRKQR